jgi:glutamate formiminotransferase/glutamate formiminotransferase/formiminotetrahydrofolate cyclodeaminase
VTGAVPTLLAVPNFSEGRSEGVVEALGAALGEHADVLNVHFDPEHNRSVFTIAAEPGPLAEALVAGARQAIELIDMRAHQGLHPHVGALDVCPAVWIAEGEREAAGAVALEVGEGIGALEVPVFLYGELAATEERRERAFFRRGGPAELARRMAGGELAPDFGPPAPHPSAGATLVTARRPLVAFNLELDTPNPEVAREVAAELREAGGGLEGVRAIGLPRDERRSQVSVNVHDPEAVPLARIAAEVRRLATELGAGVVEAELVGLAPEAALRGYGEGDPPIAGFDPEVHLIERRLAAR